MKAECKALQPTGHGAMAHVQTPHTWKETSFHSQELQQECAKAMAAL